MDKSVSILSRTNLGLRPYESALTEAGIKYFLVGKSGYWSQPEIRSVLAYLQCVLYPADHAISGALHAPFWPTKFLPRTKLLGRLKELAPVSSAIPPYWRLLRTCTSLVDSKNQQAVNDFVQFVHSLSRFRDLPAADALKSVLGALKVGDYYSEEEASLDNDPLANLGELIKIAGRHSSIKEFLDFCRRASAASKSKKGVMLSTIHSFKGMEADRVFLVQCSDDVLPHKKSTDLEGERNAFFVACSRPRTELIITYSGIPSRFLKTVVQSEEKEKTT